MPDAALDASEHSDMYVYPYPSDWSNYYMICTAVNLSLKGVPKQLHNIQTMIPASLLVGIIADRQVKNVRLISREHVPFLGVSLKVRRISSTAAQKKPVGVTRVRASIYSEHQRACCSYRMHPC